ncbi:hypothetical protein LTR07_009967 [Exophiala xenobiotica]|nr:hypothetical protein LTR90_009640 [Exophiala xenobiotica]KAK5504390.1 hypothetical protein LTR21_010527 [Exophiala xenobiotica]KAK5510185.1 hypothetical protein LTR07_009967 [Exophiala xenobiotica]
MTSHSAWIERDSQGRPYFVRSRPKRLSIRQLLVQKLLSRKDRSLFSFRDSRQNHHIQYHPGGKPPEIPAPASNSPHSPQPYDRPPTPGPPQMAPTSQGQPQPVNMYLVPPQQQNPEPPSSHVHNINAAYQHNPPSQPPFMPYVPSPMHLLPPHVPPAFPGPPFQQQMPFSMPPAPFPPPHPLQFAAGLGQRDTTTGTPFYRVKSLPKPSVESAENELLILRMIVAATAPNHPGDDTDHMDEDPEIDPDTDKRDTTLGEDPAPTSVQE